MNKICIYGDPGTGKTSFIADMALYVMKTTGKKTRVVTSDGGGIEPLLPGKELGFIEPLDISNWANPFATFQFLSSGWWPVDPEVINSPLMNGFKDYKLCPFCHQDCGAVGLTSVKQCAKCSKPFPPGTVLKPVRDPINGMDQVGAYAFEGLTSWGDRCQQLQADKLAQGDPGASAGGADSSKGGSSLRFQDGVDPEGKPVMVAGNAQPHYGASVDYLNRYVRNSDQLPGWKVWTAHERMGVEEETKRKIVGPSVPGRAGVDKCIGWFNSVLRLGFKKGTTERVLYCNTHMVDEAPGVPFRAKLSVVPTPTIPAVIQPKFGVFVETLTKAKEEAKKLIQAELQKGLTT